MIGLVSLSLFLSSLALLFSLLPSLLLSRCFSEAADVSRKPGPTYKRYVAAAVLLLRRRAGGLKIARRNALFYST